MNTTGFINEISKFSSLGASITVVEFSTALLLSCLLTVAVAKTYQLTYRGVSFSPAFMQTLVICAMVIAAVMLIIGSNIARAFSLVGALSIIRFRNAVKDPRDVAYIFLAMGIGMACGTGFYGIGIALTVLTCIAAFLMTVFRFGEYDLMEKIIRIELPQVSNFETLFNDVLAEHSEEYSLISAETSRMGTELELTFAIKVSKKFSSEKLMEELKKINDNLRIQVMGSNHILDL